MSLRKSTLLIIVMVLVGLIIVLLGSLNAILPPYFQRQEQTNAMLNIQRGLSAFNAQLGDLKRINAYWNSSELSFKSGSAPDNPSQISLPVDGNLVSLDIDLVAMFDQSGNLLEGRYIPLDAQNSQNVPQALSSRISAYLTASELKTQLSGFMQYGSSPLLLVIAPAGQGLFVTGRFFDSEIQQEIASDLQLIVTTRGFDPTSADAAGRDIQDQLAANLPQPIVRVLSSEVVAGYGLLKDPGGNPSIVIEVDQPRTYFQNSQLILNYLIITLISSTAIFSLMIFLLIETLVLRRLSRLNREVQSITAGEGSKTRVTITRKDELANLSRNINQMLDRLAKAQSDLEASYAQVRQGRARLETLSRRLVDVQEEERHAIALELHDEIGQSLTGLKLQLEAAAARPAAESKLDLKLARTNLNLLIEKVRNLSLQLRPAMLDDLGLLPTLLWHFDQYTRQTKVQVDFQQKGLKNIRFPSEIEVAAYRIIQESLTNAVRHAAIGQVKVKVEHLYGKLRIEIIDQGKGFNVQAALLEPKTSGLSGMRERVFMLGGELDIHSLPGKGTHLVIDLPLKGHLERRKNARNDSAGG